jgi:L-ascorbate 6-phosphate lactonase
MSRKIMDKIRGFEVPEGALVLWWLGQMGFLIKWPNETLISVDAYLTNNCHEKFSEQTGLNFDRRVPVFIEPEELDVDYFLCTHSHEDHADPKTIERLHKERTSFFVGPGLTCETYRRCGVEESKIIQTYPGGRIKLGEVTVLGTFALPTDQSDLNHLGYMMGANKGPRVYITGDTDYTELLGHVAPYKPDILVVCINGGFNNLSHWEAAEVARLIKPKVAIPCHYEMFPDNAVDPLQFRASLRMRAPDVIYQQLEHMTPFVFKAQPSESRLDF